VLVQHEEQAQAQVLGQFVVQVLGQFEEQAQA
jgi:hypothetical protein